MNELGYRHLSQQTSPQAAFTFIEVICILLVMSFGLLSVVGLVSYGMATAARSQGASTGMATAITVAIDPRPWVDQVLVSDWSYLPYDMNTGTPPEGNHATGYINGYYVERTETSLAADVIAQQGSIVYTRSAVVAVDVYETFHGDPVASYTTHIVRQRGQQ